MSVSVFLCVCFSLVFVIVKTVGVCIGDWMFDKGTPSLASLPKSSNRAVKEVEGCARVPDLDLDSRDAKKSTCCYSPSQHLFHKKTGLGKHKCL